MEKTLEELNLLAKAYQFGGAHNAITCAVSYRDAYCDYLEAYKNLSKFIIGLKLILPKEMVHIIENKMNESNVKVYDFNKVANLFSENE